MSERVAERIRSTIRERGPIGFDEFMDLALYGPDGFFETPPVGAAGHFVTSPHVHPFVFAHCLRDALLGCWFALEEIDPLPVVELGSGDGTLAAALLSAFAELPAPHPAFTGVEVSAGARRALGERGFSTATALDELEPFEGVIVANELLDNLPFVRVRGGRDGPAEVRVGADGDAFVDVELPWSRPGLEPPPLEPGVETVVPVGVFDLLDRLPHVLRRGYVLLIDYGPGEDSSGAVRGYRGHREVTDLLSDPGESDITAGVDPRLVVGRGRALGFHAFEPVTQAVALSALGHDRWAETMRRMQSTMRGAGRGAEAVRIWETRSRASLLTEPSGLGGFWWLLLATDGLPEPPWLERCRDALD